MGWENPEKDFLSFLLYITFFPKFLSGPLERSNHFLPQIKAEKTFEGHQVSEGMKIALIGFFKKIAIANQIAPYVLSTFNDLNSANGPWLWIMFFIFPLYLYFDFSGYTDIAIGISKTLGIDLLPNFNRPFLLKMFQHSGKGFICHFHPGSTIIYSGKLVSDIENGVYMLQYMQFSLPGSCLGYGMGQAGTLWFLDFYRLWQ